MSRGAGWKCDADFCETEAVATGDAPPEGWVVLVEREVNPFGEDYAKPTHEFCSFVCLAGFGVGRAADELEATA